MEPDHTPGDLHHVLLLADLVTTSSRTHVTIREISTRVAFVEGHPFPAVGTRCLLERGQLRLFGHLVWADATRAELHFEEEISDETLMEALKFVPPPVNDWSKPYRRPGFHEALSPKEEQLIEQMKATGQIPDADPA